jgi:2-oxoisovalerate dehydrogenase E1 component alpha subunit
MAGLRVDGNDALAVYAATAGPRGVRARAGPTLIEHFTYRAEGHSTSDDPTAYRSAHEREQWPLGDPLARLRDHLIALGEWSAEQHEALNRDVADEVKAATKEAEKNGILGHGLHHPFHTMFEDVFEELPWHLEEQATQAIRERRIKWPDWKE